MAKPFPTLDLSSLLRPPAGRRQHHNSDSSQLVRMSPPTLESEFDRTPDRISEKYRKRLTELKEGTDFSMLYRLSAEGKLVKVVRRHEFGPIDWAKVTKIEQKPVQIRAKVHILDLTADGKSEEKQTPSHKKNSFSVDAKESPVSKRISSSHSLLAARRLLNTTLSLEYGQSRKKIKPNSSVSEFLEYYKHRYVRHFPKIDLKTGKIDLKTGKIDLKTGKTDLKTGENDVKITVSQLDGPKMGQKAAAMTMKFVKMSGRLGKILGQINETRQKTPFLPLSKTISRIPPSILKPNRQYSKTRPVSPSKPLTFAEIEAKMTETQNSLKPLRQSREKTRKNVVKEMTELSAQLNNTFTAGKRNENSQKDLELLLKD